MHSQVELGADTVGFSRLDSLPRIDLAIAFEVCPPGNRSWFELHGLTRTARCG